MTLSLLIIVPARGGSKRLPRKNIRQLAGKSLLAYTAEAIAESALDAPCVLSTDDEAIAEEGRRVGLHVPALRPAALAQDDTPMSEVVLHELEMHRMRTGEELEAVLVLQPTSPLRGGACIRTAVELLKERDDVDSVIAMSATNIPASHMFHAGSDGTTTPVSDDLRRPVYVPNGALYLTRTQKLREEKTLYAGAILPLPLDPVRAIDIDTQTDWLMAEAFLRAGLPAGASKSCPPLREVETSS